MPAPSAYLFRRASSLETLDRSALQTILDYQSGVISTCDIVQYLETVSLPYRRLSLTHDALLESEADVKTGLISYVNSAKTAGIDLFYRELGPVRHLSANYVEGLYTAHQMCRANHAIPPYTGRFVLARQGRAWRMIESERQLVTQGWAADLNASTSNYAMPIEFAENDVRLQGLDPLATYQAHLDAIAASEVADDFETYCSYLRFPHTTHSMRVDNVIKGPEDIRPFFDMIKKTRNGEVGDRLERTAEQAEFLGSDLLVGYHTGRAFKNGWPAIEPVSSRMILQRNNDRWQLISVANTIQNKEYPFDMYAPGDELSTDIDIQRRIREWPSFLKKRT